MGKEQRQVMVERSGDHDVRDGAGGWKMSVAVLFFLLLEQQTGGGRAEKRS